MTGGLCYHQEQGPCLHHHDVVQRLVTGHLIHDQEHMARRHHENAVVKRLVAETHQQLLFSSVANVQEAAFMAVLQACVQDLSSSDLDQVALNSGGSPNQAATSFAETAKLIHAVVKARPDAFAVSAFDQLSSAALQKGEHPSLLLPAAARPHLQSTLLPSATALTHL